MRLTPRPLLWALAAGSLSLNAWAQSGTTPPAVVSAQTSVQISAQASPQSPCSQTSGWREQHRHQRLEKRMQHQQQRQDKALQSLALTLQLQPSQQPAWQRFEQAMKARPANAASTPTAVQAASDLPAQVAQLKARKAAHDAAFEQRLQAVLDLHASLDTQQQQVLSERAAHWLQGAHGLGRHPERGEGRGKHRGAPHGQGHGHPAHPA